MATKKTTAKKRNAANAQPRSSASAQAQPRKATRNNFDFTGFQNFAKPNALFNLPSLASFQPANLQGFFQQLAATSQKNLEALTACTQLCVERAKDVLEEHANLSSELLQETATTWQDALSSSKSDPRAKLEDMSEFAKYCLQKSTDIARKTTEESLQVCQELGQELNKRFTDAVEELRTAA